MSLIYNGIAFSYPQTEVHIMGPGMDPSGTDQLFTTIRLRVRAVLYVNSSTGIGLPPAIPGTDLNSGQLLTRIRHMLTAPRQPLYYDFLSVVGTTSGLPPSAIIDLPDGLDDANGPMPDADAFSIAYTTPDCLEVAWSCTVKLKDCGFGSSDDPLSLRWEDSLTWDKYCKATYQRVGTCIISSRSTQKLDDLRRTTFAPRIAAGFCRTQAHYTVSRDGLRCDFAFRDEQIRYAPPYPAIEMEIVQNETFPYVNGMRSGEVSVTMTGIQNANVRDLLMWALTVAKARVWAANPLQTAKGIVVGGQGQAPPVVRTRETTDSVDVAVVMPYKVPARKNQETQSSSSNAFWGGLVGFGIGTVIGGPVGGIIGAGIGALAGGNAAPTQQGKDPSKQPLFPWVGFGTSPAGPTNPLGYAKWADATGSIGGPSDGVSLAPAVSLFAAILQDPCGSELDNTPFANGGFVDLRTDPNSFNTTVGGGQGGSSQVKDAQLTASLSAFNSTQYPQVYTSTDSTSLYNFDEQPGAYDYWQCVNEYHSDPGIIVLPTCNPDGTNIQVNHSSEMVTLRKRWAACRTGAPPTLPPPNLGDPNWVFVGNMVGPREMRIAPDGVSFIYEVSGVYEYQALNASIATIQAEIPPFLSTQALQSGAGWINAQFGLLGLGALPQPFLQFGTGDPLGGGSLPSPLPP